MIEQSYKKLNDHVEGWTIIQKSKGLCRRFKEFLEVIIIRSVMWIPSVVTCEELEFSKAAEADKIIGV